MPLETDFGPVTGSIQIAVLDPHGITPTPIIRRGDGWRLHAEWELNGPLVVMLDGEWRFQAYLESFGPQPEIMCVNETIDFSEGIDPTDPQKLVYEKDYDIPGNVPAEDGVYRIVGVLTCRTPSDTPGPFAGFDMGPMLQFYEHP